MRDTSRAPGIGLPRSNRRGWVLARGSLLLATLVGSPPAWAACPIQLDGFFLEIEAGTQHYGVDWSTFDQDVDQVQHDLDCLAAPATPWVSAQLHLLEALHAGSEHQESDAVMSFRGLLAYQSDYTPPTSLVAPGSSLARALAEARAGGSGERVPLGRGQWLVDGVSAEELPLDRAALVQRIPRRGPPQSWYVQGGPLPEALDRLTEPTWGSQHASTLMTMSSAGALAGSAAVFLLVARPTYAETQSGRSSDSGLRTLNHASIIGGYALATGGAVLLTGAVLRGSW